MKAPKTVSFKGQKYVRADPVETEATTPVPLNNPPPKNKLPPGQPPSPYRAYLMAGGKRISTLQDMKAMMERGLEIVNPKTKDTALHIVFSRGGIAPALLVKFLRTCQNNKPLRLGMGTALNKRMQSVLMVIARSGLINFYYKMNPQLAKALHKFIVSTPRAGTLKYKGKSAKEYADEDLAYAREEAQEEERRQELEDEGKDEDEIQDTLDEEAAE